MKQTIADNSAQEPVDMNLFLTYEDVAMLLRRTKEAIRKLTFRDSGPDELPAVLRHCRVTTFSRKRPLIARAPFMEWFNRKVSAELRQNERAHAKTA